MGIYKVGKPFICYCLFFFGRDVFLYCFSFYRLDSCGLSARLTYILYSLFLFAVKTSKPLRDVVDRLVRRCDLKGDLRCGSANSPSFHMPLDAYRALAVAWVDQGDE